MATKHIWSLSLKCCYVFWDQIVYMSSRKQSRVSYISWVEISFLRLESFGINKNVQTAVTGLKLKSWLKFVWDLYTRCRTEMNFSSHEMLGKKWEIYTVIAMVTKLLRIPPKIALLYSGKKPGNLFQISKSSR